MRPNLDYYVQIWALNHGKDIDALMSPVEGYQNGQGLPQHIWGEAESWVCLTIRRGSSVGNLNAVNYHIKKEFTVRVVKHWNPEKLWNTQSLEMLKTQLGRPWGTWPNLEVGAKLWSQPCLEWVVGPDDLQRSLPTKIILRFCYLGHKLVLVII